MPFSPSGSGGGSSVLQADTTVTVGSGGDYATINEALEYLSQFFPAYIQEGYTAEISLLTGFVMSEQVIAKGVNLGWITITSVDAEVVIDRSALTIGFEGAFPAFAACNGTLPIIDVLFNMDSSGSATTRDGINISTNSDATALPGKGVKNAGGKGAFIAKTSRAELDGAVFTGAGTYGIEARDMSHVNAESSDTSGATTGGLRVISAGLIEASGATGTLSQTANTLTGNGIIFQ